MQSVLEIVPFFFFVFSVITLELSVLVYVRAFFFGHRAHSGKGRGRNHDNTGHADSVRAGRSGKGKKDGRHKPATTVSADIDEYSDDSSQ